MTRGFRWALLTGASIAALGMAAGAASAADLTLQGPGLVGGAPLPGVSSVLSLWAGGALLSSDDTDYDSASYFTFGGDARVAGQAWQLELAAAAHTGTSSDDGEKEGSSYAALAGHWLNRGPDMTWGLFIGGAGTGHQETDDWSGHLFGGGEWAGFYGNNTVFAQAGGVVAVLGEVTDTWENGLFGRVGWRYFFDPDRKFEADVMAGWGRFDDDNTGWTFAWGAEYEHRLGTTGPFSGFLFYRGHYVADSSGGTAESAIDHVFGVGLRVDVGTGTLLDRDRVGAGTFNIPDFHRTFSWPDQL